MKRFLSTLTLLLCFAFTAVNAQVITAERAAEIANSFFSAGVQKSGAARGVVSSPSLTSSFDSNDVTETASAEPTFYVLTNPEGGFVIVSGEETENPIIGYSLDGTIDVNNLPDGFVGYMTDIDAQVKSLREYNANNPQKAAAARSAMQRAANFEYNATSMGNIVKNLNTAPWGQRTPFNKLCPVVGTGNAVTGCVPTAYSILCRYYEWPEQGVGTVYNPSSGDPLQLGHTYDYASMRNDNYPSGYTEAEANAVATLMRDMGYAYTATYGSGTTTTSSENPSNLIKYFGFKCETPLNHGNGCTKYDMVNNMEQWVTYIKNCLNAGYPIPYSSTTALDAQDRHIYILDGYTDNNYFHFNWGWFGSGNGWFTLDNMVPDNYSNYSKSHRAYFNVIPDKTTYTVTARANDSNMGTVSINGGTAGSTATANLFSGATATLTAHPAQGYALASWTKGGVIVGTRNTLQVPVGTDGNDYVANFDDEANVLVEKDCTFNISAVSTSGVNGDYCSTWTTSDGIVLSCTKGAEPAYALSTTYNTFFAKATVGNSETLVTDITYTLTAPEGYVIKSYSFKGKSPSSSYTIDVNVAGNTTNITNASAGVVISASDINAQSTSFVLSSTYNRGRPGLSIMENGITVTIQSEGGGSTPTPDPEPEPDPTPTTYAVTTTANPAAGGTAKFSVGTGSQKTQGDVENGTQITLYATANTGYNFVKWTLNGNVVGTDATCNVSVAQASNYVANFEANVPAEPATNLGGKYFRLKEKTTGKYMNIENNAEHPGGTIGGVNVTAKNESYDGQIFQFIESGTGYKLLSKTGYYIKCQPWNVDAISEGTVLSFETAGADNEYFIKWDNTNMNEGVERDDYFKIQNVGGITYVYCDAAQGAAATWVLEEVVYYTVTATAGNGGSVSPSTSTVEKGKPVTLTATANEGYRFVNWTLNGNVVSTNASYTVTNVTANAEYVANFEINTYTISVTANPGTAGSVTINGEAVSSKNVNENSTVTLVATPQAGYCFVNWTTLNGNVVSTNATYSFTATEITSLVANFEQIVVNVTLTDAQSNTYNVQLSGFTNGVTTATVAAKLTEKYPYITLGTVENVITLNGSNGAYTYTNTVELPFKVSNATYIWHNIYYPANSNDNPNYIATLNKDEVVDMAASKDYAYGDNPTYNTKDGGNSICWAIYNVNNSFEFIFKSRVTGKYIKVESVSSSTTENVKFVENAKDATAFTLLAKETVDLTGVYPAVTGDCDFALVANIDETTGYLCATSSDKDYVTHFDRTNHQGAWVKFVEAPDYFSKIMDMGTMLGYRFGAGDRKCVIAGTNIEEVDNAMQNSGSITLNKLNDYAARMEAAMATENPTWFDVKTSAENGAAYITLENDDPELTSKRVPGGYELTVKATPATGYHFTGWTMNGTAIEGAEGDNDEHTFTVTEATTIVASFAINTYTVNVSTNGTGGNATASATTVEHGGEVTLTAAENDGYDFAGWYNGETKVSSDAEYTVTNVTSDINYTARFEEEAGETPTTHAIHIVTVDTNGNPLTNNATGPVKAVINIGGRDWVTDEDFGHGATADLVATSDFNQSAYLFDGWYKNGEFVSMDSEISVTVTETATYQARFIKGYVVTLASDNKTEGYPNMITYPDGSPVVGAATELKAVVKPNEEVLISINPNYGFRVANWTDKDGNEVAGKNANSFTLKITGDNKYTAHIERATYTLSVSTQQGTMGEVSAKFMENSGTSVVVGHNQPATITASPYTGYRFVEWTTTDGTHVSDEKTYTVPAIENVEDMVDVEYVAIFEESEEVEAGTYYRIAYDFEVPVAAKTAATRAVGEVVEYSITPATGTATLDGDNRTSSWSFTTNEGYPAGLTLKATYTIINDNVSETKTIKAIQVGNSFVDLRTGGLSDDGVGNYNNVTFTLSVQNSNYQILGYDIKSYITSSYIKFIPTGESLVKDKVYGERFEPTTEHSFSFESDKIRLVQLDYFYVYIQEVGGSETPEPDTETVRYYVQSDAVSGTNNAMIMRSEDDENYNVASSIFYYAGNKLLSYKEGRYLNEGSNNTRGLQNVGVEGGDVEFIENKIKESSGTPMVYLHANEDNGTYFVDR